MAIALQTAPPGGGLIAYLSTFLFGWVYYAITAHLAALYVLGDTPHQKAAAVGIVPGAVSLGLGTFSMPVIAPIVIVFDAVAIHYVYRLTRRGTALLTLAHCTISVLLGVALFNLASLL